MKKKHKKSKNPNFKQQNINKQILKPLSDKHLKLKRLIGFDIETYGDDNKFYMAGLFFPDGSYMSFYSQEEFLKEIMKKKYFTNTYIVATNLAFDYVGTFFNTELWNKGETIMSNGRLLTVTFKNIHKQRLSFIDSFNHAPFSVTKMGEILGLPKLNKPRSLGRIPNSEEERLELEEYNKRDCEVTLRFMELLAKGYYDAGGKLKITIASSSLDIFRRRYLRHPIYKEISQLGYSVNNQIFYAYYGGRTEVFTRGVIENVNHLAVYDVNSLFPTGMLNHYPNPKSVKHEKQGSVDIIQEYEGVTFVKLFCPEMNYPLLPMRIDNKLVFPTGNIEGYYTHVELRKAFELGYYLREIGETIYYKKVFYPFKEFVLDMYKQRKHYKSINHPNEIVYKLCLNSLYGKFATKSFSDTTFFNINHLSDEEIDSVRANPNTFMKDDLNGMIIQKKPCDEAYVIPIFSCYTTAYARLILYDYLESSEALYCDTDCVITKKHIPESLELGGMKLEHDSTIEKAILVKPKMYYLKLSNGKEIIKLKGIPKKILFNEKEKKLDSEDFLRVLNNEPLFYVKFNKLKESVRRGLTPNAKTIVRKDIKLDDTKRVWEKNFTYLKRLRSKPIHISEGLSCLT